MELQYPYGFVRKPELRHQYGMLFNHHGYVMSGLKNLELFLSIELPKITDIQHMPPPFPNCDNWAIALPSRKDGYITSLGFSTGPGVMRQMENKKMTKFLEEAMHTVVCRQYKYKYRKLLERIDAIKHNITYKIKKVMPRLLPNEWAVLYGKETMIKNNRVKCAIPLGLMFSGVSALGGLIMKGINTWSNYKKTKAMQKAIEQLYDAQKIDHARLRSLEEQTSLLANAMKTAFQHIGYRLIHLDVKLNATIHHMTDFFQRRE